jgi:hypothetical protein
MAVCKRLLRKDRLRQVPHQFSWIDHRLVGDRHISRCSANALALYLFLLTVADGQGLSYYGDGAICRLLAMLSLDAVALARARQELIDNQLIAWQRPLYQVLALGPSQSQMPSQAPSASQPQPPSQPQPVPRPPLSRPPSRPSSARRGADDEQPAGQSACPHSIAQILQRLMEGAKP